MGLRLVTANRPMFLTFSSPDQRLTSLTASSKVPLKILFNKIPNFQQLSTRKSNFSNHNKFLLFTRAKSTLTPRTKSKVTSLQATTTSTMSSLFLTPVAFVTESVYCIRPKSSATRNHCHRTSGEQHVRLLHLSMKVFP
jgi:hypothetical protein